jgi:hypothetical protein
VKDGSPYSLVDNGLKVKEAAAGDMDFDMRYEQEHFVQLPVIPKLAISTRSGL